MFSPLLAVCLMLMAREASAIGLGEKTMYQEGSVLDADFQKAKNADSFFMRDSSGKPTEANDEKFVELVKELQVDVVAPSKDLAKMMNLASTKSRATFLDQYERYFKALDVGSVSRPMLLSYLGLEFAEQEQLDSWYGPLKSRISDKVVRSCESLAAKRAELHKTHGEADSQLGELMEGDQMHKLHCAYLTFHNNLNLFMLENYLLLCSRLEPEKFELELNKSGSMFQRAGP